MIIAMYCNVLPCIAGLSVAVGLNNIFHIFSWQWVFLADGKMGCLWPIMAPLWPMAIALHSWGAAAKHLRGLRKELCILMPATNSTPKQVRVCWSWGWVNTKYITNYIKLCQIISQTWVVIHLYSIHIYIYNYIYIYIIIYIYSYDVISQLRQLVPELFWDG